MNCLSLNIKGIVEDAKVGWVKKLKNINKNKFHWNSGNMDGRLHQN